MNSIRVVRLSVRQLRMLFIDLFNNSESDIVVISDPVDYGEIPDYRLLH